MESNVRIAHLALDLGLGYQCRDRVYNDDVDRAGTNHGLRDLERLLAVIGL